MPRYEPDPSKVSATIVVLPKDRYEFIVGEPKAYERTTKKNSLQQYGVMFPLTVAEGPLKDKKIFFNGGQDNDIAQSVTKQFCMAAMGFSLNEQGEADFNHKYNHDDWSYNTDDKSVGEFWKKLKGKRVNCDVDITMADDGSGTQYQKFVKWHPLSLVAA